MASAEQREFAQFCKYFTIRAIQVIVQSRHGRKIRMPSRIITQRRDWFSLNIDEIPEINQQIIQSLSGHYLPTLDCVNVLISLRTSDGETLHLEIWQLNLDSEQIADSSSNNRNQLYHRMSIMLRSIIAASRTTPAYKLYARRQGAESFVLCYEISCGSPNPQTLLGDGVKTAELGYVVSPFGSLKAALHYRTKMVISGDSPEISAISQSVDENYYQSNFEQKKRRNTTTECSSEAPAIEQESVTPSSSSSLPRHHKCSPFYQQPVLHEIGPWQPLAEPSPSKISPMPDFSPCFSTFSTSPESADFYPYSPSMGRKPSVAFQVGATSGSSSEEGGSCHYLQSSGAVVPFGLIQTGADTTPKRNSSSGIFRLELSEGAGSAKPSSVPDCFGRGRSSSSVIKCDSFPFSQLLSSCSAPAFGSTTTIGFIGGPHRGSQQLALRSPKRTVIEEEVIPDTAGNLEDSREITTSDGVKIYEKRKKNAKKKKNGAGDQVSDGEDSSSSDDSFVRIEIKPVFAPSQTSAGDASAFLSQCKLAPAQLKSFQIFEHQRVAGNAQTSPSSSSSDIRRGSLEEIPSQLKEFEEKQKMFDDFVKSLLNKRVDEASSEEGENDET